MINITSNQNQILKEARSLKNRSSREEKGLFFVEGARIVEEALKEKAGLEYTIWDEEFPASDRGGLLERLTQAGCRNYSVPGKLFRELADTETPQGILAVIRMNRPEADAVFSSGGHVVILDTIRDPGNMGTIIRTADAAGFKGIVASAGSVDIYNPKVLRSTMGSIFHIPVYTGISAADAIRLAKSKGFRVFASHLEGAVSIYDTDLSASSALVIGSEAEGVGREAAETADLLVKIPMEGRAESLNASVAAGVMMYEAVRQKILRLRHNI